MKEEKQCIKARMLRPGFCFPEESRGHLKKQGDSAVVDGGRYFVGADHQSGRTAQEHYFGMTIQRTVKHSSEENSEQFRGKF